MTLHGSRSMVLLAWLSLLSLLALAAADGHEDAGKAETLNKDSFDRFLAEQLAAQRPALVMFHVNWCKVCQKTFPKFAASSTLIAEQKIPLDFAHVDCTNDKTLCQRFGVKGYPTIKLFPPKENSEPTVFRGTRSEEGFLKYARRMTQPPLRELADHAALLEAMKEEPYAGFLVAAAAADAAPAGFKAAAERMRDRHLFMVVPDLQAALPAGAAVPAGASLAVFSTAAQQWKGVGEGAPAVAFYDGALDDAEAVGEWMNRYRFPGVWALGESSFYEFTHSGRKAAIVSVDPGAISEHQERRVRGAAAQHAGEFLVGVLDGVAWADEMSDFNMHKEDLPRVLVTVDDFEHWYEDIEELRLESLASDLEGLRSGSKQLLLQGRTLMGRLQFYQRETLRRAERLYAYAQLGPREAALASAAAAAGLALLMTVGWCAVACCRVLLSEDTEPWDRHKAHTKVD